jgi:hypothetical protein
MKKIAGIAIAIALADAVGAQVLPGGNVLTRSHSGQFVVRASQVAPDPTRRSNLETNISFISLEPTLLVVSCERIKQALWRKLGAPASWRGNIYLNLHSARSADDPVAIVSEKFTDGWAYHVELPELLKRERFVRAMVQVLLVEVANRNADSRSAEIPAWLVEGLARELLASAETEIILPPPRWNVRGLTIRPEVVNGRKPHPLEQAQKNLRARPPLTFDELSWPTGDQFSGEAGAVYQSSAQLFVDRLLSLADGPACLRAMIAELPRHCNWQIAFLNAFHRHFQRPLDVEKWWALQLVQFTGRDLTQTWTPEQSWKKLDETVRQAVEVRTRGSELPLRSEVSLQTIIREWDVFRQAQVLQQKLNELQLLRLRIAQNLVALVDDYRQVIGAYLQRQNTSVPRLPLGKQMTPLPNRAADEIIRQLDALDARRAALRPASQDPVTGALETMPGTSR